ncbi:MAG: FtsW/RodA/SpoVE family cell cycle protein [Lachnospiraceae bacterium]|nr:FtsW/RodA/SpoVE family cell cycle protein [Lachnospiraceae bacterium]
MTTWITATSNFIFVILLAIYVIAAYSAMWTRRWEAGFARSMGLCRYLLHGVGFLVLYLTAGEFRLLPLYFFQLAFFLFADIIQKRVYTRGIPMLYQNMMLLLSVGFVILARLSYENAVKQFIMAVVAYQVCSFIPWLLRRFPGLMRLGWLYTLAGLGLLAVVLAVGSEVFGAKNWLTIKNITFQPSEFVKLTFILSMAALLIRETNSKYKNLLAVSIVAALHVGLLALSNDFGGALIFFTVYLLMLFVVSADVLFPTAALLSGSLAALLAYRYSGHIRERVMAWQDPFSCIEDEGYQVAQSLFAIGSGEWFGTGLNLGMPKTVPIVKSDFVFSAVSEEFGAVFAALLLCVYINCIIWMMALALERKQPFFFAVTTGAVALFGVQLFLNVGGVIKLIPSTGVTLSFISYGGSSLFSSVFLFQGIQAMRGEDEEKKKKEEWNYTGQQIRMVVVCAAILLLLCVMTSWFLSVTVKEAEKNYFNEYNRRISVTEKTMPKGQILAADGSILARSILGEDGTAYRMYPHGEAAIFVTGQMNLGRTGMEKQYWKQMYSVDIPLWSRWKRKVSGEVPEGNSLVTTIDLELQKAAFDALEGYSGAIGVMEVGTGRILAFTSAPSYDPNEISVQWEALQERTDAPLLNRLNFGLYPPGSTFKLVTTLAYLRQHEEAEFSYTCEGSARFRNTTVHCNNEKAHGTQTLKEAFANSCNTAYAYMGEQISDEDFMAVAEELGLRNVWAGDISYKESLFSMNDETEDAVRVQASFGQGETLVTPFQMLMIGSGIANKGILKMPYLVEQIVNCEGDVVEQYTSTGEQVLMSEDTAALLTEYMVAASEEKMPEFAERGITVAGKTGSAETAEGTHSWYVCFAPADNPEIAIVVLMEHAGTGSRYAVPAAKKLLEVYFED